jgi:prepilin-type N-terminal cleavage/methylation domain-containing protein
VIPLLSEPYRALRKSRGVTLLELMAALLILGLIAALGYTQYTEVLDHSETSGMFASLATMDLEAHSVVARADGVVPTTVEELLRGMKLPQGWSATTTSPTSSREVSVALNGSKLGLAVLLGPDSTGTTGCLMAYDDLGVPTNSAPKMVRVQYGEAYPVGNAALCTGGKAVTELASAASTSVDSPFVLTLA